MRKPQEWGQPCPNPACTHSRRMPQGNVSAIATYLTPSGTRRLWRCHPCATPFAETRATVFCDLRTSEDTGMMALTMLLVRVELAGISLVLGVTAETVVAWLRRAAHQAEAITPPGCAPCLSPRGNARRWGTASDASLRRRRTRQAQACQTARRGGKGSGAAWRPSFGGGSRPWWAHGHATPPRRSWRSRRPVARASRRAAATASRALWRP
jgi:transposase-like protein